MTEAQQERLKTDANEFIDRAIAMMKEGELTRNVGLYNGIVSLLEYAKESHEAQRQQPIPQDINIEDEAKKERSKLLFTKRDEQTFYFGFNKCAQLLPPELQQLREEVKNLKNMMEFIEKDRQAIREKLETTELIAKGNQNSYNAAKGKIEQQKSQIEQLYGKLEYAQKGFPENEKGLMQAKIDLQQKLMDEQAAEIQSLKQEITEANGILRSCNSIIERRGEKTNWLAIEYKIKERLKKQHEILKQQTHG